jgi:hypothetical protein
MTPSRSALADAIDALAAAGRAVVTETRHGIILNRLGGHDARQLMTLFATDGWTEVNASDEGGDLSVDMIDADAGDIRIRAGKPDVPDEVEALLTRVGFTAALERPHLEGLLWVHGLQEAFETLTVRFAPWGDHADFQPQLSPLSPRKVVRVLDDGLGFPDDLGRWLLRDHEAKIVGRAAQPWQRLAIERLGKAIANEIEPDGRLLFKGPPTARFTPAAGALIEATSVEMLGRAVRWVYDNPREIENRHGLLAAEVARTSLADGNASDLAHAARSALDSAKIAYNFGVTQQSRDTLKALAELRKAIGDETAKLGENTRALATAVAGSVIANLGIVIARVTLPANATWVPWAALVIAVVLAIYVGSVIISGAHFLRLQALLRTEWRQRLYRFLDDDEYQRMVSTPVASAERGFWIACCIAAVMTILLLLAVTLIAGPAWS